MHGKDLTPTFTFHQLKITMPDTYTQLYIQFVFAVKFRDNLIRETSRDQIEKYLTGIARSNKHKMLSIYCMPDHTHILIGLNPVQSISSLANDLKSNSSKWINSQKLCKHHFNWQEGYGAFSYSHSQISYVYDHILNQERHHAKQTFQAEYLDFLKKFEIEHDVRYLFEWLAQ